MPGQYSIGTNLSRWSVFNRRQHEVDTLSPAAQTRLLRVIQEGELERVGGKRTLSVDLRIISATNQNLEALVKQGLFRNDLYYRINVVRLSIPPWPNGQKIYLIWCN